MDLAYETGALSGDVTPLQYWALAYYLVSKKRDADERADLERRWHAFFTNRKLYEQVFPTEPEDEQSAELVEDDFMAAERMLEELDRKGELTISEDNAGDWI